MKHGQNRVALVLTQYSTRVSGGVRIAGVLPSMRVLAADRALVALSLAALLAATGIPARQVPRGPVVEAVTNASLGVQVGNRVVSYDGVGIESPFTLQAAEENPQGTDDALLIVADGEVTRSIRAVRGVLGLALRPDLAPPTAALYEEGAAAERSNNRAQLIEHWTAAAESAKRIGDNDAAAWLLGRVGELHERQASWAAARDAHAARWALVGAGSDAAHKSRALAALGRVSQNLKAFDVAAEWYARGETIDSRHGWERWAAAGAMDAGSAHHSKGDFALARSCYQRALAVWERIDAGSLAVAETLHRLGLAWQAQNDNRAAETVYLRALEIRERLAPDSDAVARTLNNLGIIAWARSDLSTAEAYFDRMYAIFLRTSPGLPVIASALTNLGLVARERGELSVAQERLAQALAIRRAHTPGTLDEAVVLNNLGDVTRLAGDLLASERYHHQAIAIRERITPGSMEVAHSLNNLGSLARDLGDLPAALDYQRRALAIRERVAPGSIEVAHSYNNLGNVARSSGDQLLAADYLTRAVELYERLAPNSLDLASTVFNLGHVARDRGDLDLAKSYFTRSLTLRQERAPESLFVSNSLDGLGDVARERGDLGTARDLFAKALAIRERLAPDSLAVADSLSGLAKLALRRGDIDDAATLARRALDLRRARAPHSLVTAASLNDLARALVSGGDYTAARARFAEATAIVESQRARMQSAESRALLLAQHTEAYAGLARTEVAAGDIATAFATAERGHARSLTELLTEPTRDIRRGADPQLLARERTLQLQLNAAAARQGYLLGQQRRNDAAAATHVIDDLLRQYRELQQQLRATSPHYATFAQPETLSLAAVQRDVLDGDSLLLEYLLGEDGSLVFAVTPTSAVAFELPARGVIESATRTVYSLMVARQPVADEALERRQRRIAQAAEQLPEAIAALSEMLLGPVAQFLTNRRLLIVADGALHYLPFAALIEPRQGEGQLPREPLVVRHEIVTLPSASALAALRRATATRPVADGVVAVIADPVFDSADSRVFSRAAAAARTGGTSDVTSALRQQARTVALLDSRGSLARLPFTRQEADAIVSLVPPQRSLKAVDFDANRDLVIGGRLAGYRVVHFATHAIVDTDRPELSGIVLSLTDAHGRSTDGVLRLHDVYNLEWAADLIVLSACQSALGKDIRGEGLVGVARGFMYGGAKSIVASLWNVNDSVTARLMATFYRGYLREGLSSSEALRAAQIEIWKRPQWRDPYFWAAFVLQGEWR
jgi:CHAT domain-containing protein/Tfp pilus assembly protein PilF